MNIKKLVREMRAHARKHVYDPMTVMQGKVVDEGCVRVEDYKGVRVTFMLSLNDHKPLFFWSLSLSCRGPMTDEFAEGLAAHFFDPKNGPVVVNPPNLMAPHMKQYGQQEKRQ